MSNRAIIKQGWLRAAVGLVVFYLVVDNSVYIPRLIMRIFGVSMDRLCIVANNLIFLILAVYLFRRFIDRKSFISLGFSTKGFKKDILLGIMGSLVLIGTGFLILYVLGRVEIISFNLELRTLLYWVMGLLFAAALEEVPLRGYMLDNMMESMNNYVAVGIISVVFGFLHATGQNASIIGILNCTLLGVLVGLYYVHRRNIWVPIAFHAGWNVFQGTIFGFNVSGRSFDYSLLTTKIFGAELASGGKVGLEGSLILTFLTILAIVIFVIRSSRPGAADLQARES